MRVDVFLRVHLGIRCMLDAWKRLSGSSELESDDWASVWGWEHRTQALCKGSPCSQPLRLALSSLLFSFWRVSYNVVPAGLEHFHRPGWVELTETSCPSFLPKLLASLLPSLLPSISPSFPLFLFHFYWDWISLWPWNSPIPLDWLVSETLEFDFPSPSREVLQPQCPGCCCYHYCCCYHHYDDDDDQIQVLTLAWAVGPSDLPVSPTPTRWGTGACCRGWLLCGCRDLNSGPQGLMGGVLETELPVSNCVWMLYNVSKHHIVLH